MKMDIMKFNEIMTYMIISYFIAIVAYSMDIERKLQSGTYKSLFYGTEYIVKVKDIE